MERSLIIILITLSIVLLIQINGQKLELIAGHVLFRHGDRTPITTYSTDPIQEKDWPNGFGQLTTAGIEQAHRLGKYLRTRYGSILNSKYNRREIYVRSTDYDRTLMTAQSTLIGLYPLSNISKDSVPIQPIPIHTVPTNQDFLLGANSCPKYNQIQDKLFHTDEVKRLNAYYEPFFQKLRQWTNKSKVSVFNTDGILGAVLVEHIYNKAPVWADENVRRNLSDIRDFQIYYPSINKDSNRIRGGPLIKDIWKNMNNLRHGEQHWKVKMYSAHDTTLSPVLFFLGIQYRRAPQYASAVFIDLYKQKSSYFVKVEFLNVTDSNIAYPYILPGCPAFHCPFHTFTSIYQPRFPENAEIECK